MKRHTIGCETTERERERERQRETERDREKEREVKDHAAFSYLSHLRQCYGHVNEAIS